MATIVQHSPATAPAAYPRELLLALYERMVLIREFEERVKYLFLEGVMPGTIHQCQGQEATAVGVCSALNPDDVVCSTHRPHGHALAKGLSPEELLIELFGGGSGCCKGKGGSMHVGNLAKGMLPAIAIVGGNIPLAAGIGLAFRMQKTPQVAVAFFGDGATSEGAFHEGVNLAAIWDLPVLFACENNRYGASTHITRVSRRPSIAERADAYGIRGETVDGNDVLAVLDAARRAVAECRAGQGPVLLELMTYRITGHSRRDPCHYQPKEEREEALRQEPIGRFARQLLAQRPDIAEADLAAVRAAVDRRLTAAVEVGRRAPPPLPEEVLSDVYA